MRGASGAPRFGCGARSGADGCLGMLSAEGGRFGGAVGASNRFLGAFSTGSGCRVGGIMSGALPGCLSFFASSCCGDSLKGVPSGDVVRLDGVCLRSFDFPCRESGVLPAALAGGSKPGVGFTNRSFLPLPGAVEAGAVLGFRGADAAGAGEWSFAGLSLPFPCVDAGVAAAGAVAMGREGAACGEPGGFANPAGDVGAIGADEADGARVWAAFSPGLLLGGGTFFGSSPFIFCFNSACIFGSETWSHPFSMTGLAIFSFTVFGATGAEAFCNVSGAATTNLSPSTLVIVLDLAAAFGSTLVSRSSVIRRIGLVEYWLNVL